MSSTLGKIFYLSIYIIVECFNYGCTPLGEGLDQGGGAQNLQNQVLQYNPLLSIYQYHSELLDQALLELLDRPYEVLILRCCFWIMLKLCSLNQIF